MMRTLSSYSIKFYFEGKGIFFFLFFFFVTESAEFKMENLRLNLKLLAYK